MRDLLEPQYLAVEASGPLVLLHIGNVRLVMEYATAIQASTWMRACAKAAKRAARDDRRAIAAIGLLTALEREPAPRKYTHLGQRDLIDPQRLELSTEGTLVCFRYGRALLKLDYESATQLSIWLRVRGKEAKHNAGGDTRHWSEIGNVAAVLNGERPFGEL